MTKIKVDRENHKADRREESIQKQLTKYHHVQNGRSAFLLAQSDCQLEISLFLFLLSPPIFFSPLTFLFCPSELFGFAQNRFLKK